MPIDTDIPTDLKARLPEKLKTPNANTVVNAETKTEVPETITPDPESLFFRISVMKIP